MKFLILAAAALLACGPPSDDDGTAGSPVPAPDTSHAAPLPAPAGSGWSVHPKGAGPVRIGMSFGELAPLLRTPADTAGIGAGCRYLAVAGAPDSVMFMVEGGRLVRVDVIGGPTSSAEGALIGDTEQRIMQLYPDARRSPHKYTDGNYLTVSPGSGTDSIYRYVFETDGARVTRFRAGVYPPVEYVEGCS